MHSKQSCFCEMQRKMRKMRKISLTRRIRFSCPARSSRNRRTALCLRSDDSNPSLPSQALCSPALSDSPRRRPGRLPPRILARTAPMASSAPASARWSAISAARGSRVRAPALAPTRGPRTRPAGPRARGVVRPAPARRRVASPRAGAHFQAQAEPELPLGTQIENALLGAFPPGCALLPTPLGASKSPLRVEGRLPAPTQTLEPCVFRPRAEIGSPRLPRRAPPGGAPRGRGGAHRDASATSSTPPPERFARHLAPPRAPRPLLRRRAPSSHPSLASRR